MPPPGGNFYPVASAAAVNERVAGGFSEKQLGDALRVYELQFGQLDLNYIDEWAERLGIASLWERLKGEARIVEE